MERRDTMSDDTAVGIDIRPFKEFQKEFKLGRLLGQGSYGVVRKCRHKKTKIAYAVKLVPVTNDDNKKIRNEVAILSDPNLQGHNYIITWHRVYHDEENMVYYLVFDYCTGGNANEYMDRVALENDEFATEVLGHLGLNTNPFCRPIQPKEIERRVRNVLSQLLCAVRHCHEVVGVVHRDIKPENILLKDVDDDNPYIQLIDFGMAHRIDDDVSSQSRVGTVVYAAPEVINWNECPSTNIRAGDMWSVGAVAYTLLYGRPPFIGKDDLETKTEICRAEVKFPESPSFSEEAKDFIATLLSRDPSQRPTASQAQRHSWLQSNLGSSLNRTNRMNSKSCSSIGSTKSVFGDDKASKARSKSGLLKLNFSWRKRTSEIDPTVNVTSV